MPSLKISEMDPAALADVTKYDRFPIIVPDGSWDGSSAPTGYLNDSLYVMDIMPPFVVSLADPAPRNAGTDNRSNWNGTVLSEAPYALWSSADKWVEFKVTGVYQITVTAQSDKTDSYGVHVNWSNGQSQLDVVMATYNNINWRPQVPGISDGSSYTENIFSLHRSATFSPYLNPGMQSNTVVTYLVVTSTTNAKMQLATKMLIDQTGTNFWKFNASIAVKRLGAAP